MIKLIYYRVTFQDEKGNITHSNEGVALCDGDPNEDSFKRNIASRHYRSGDLKMIFSLEVLKQVKPKQ